MTRYAFDNELYCLGSSREETGMGWKEITDRLNTDFSENKTIEAYRKRYNRLCMNSEYEPYRRHLTDGGAQERLTDRIVSSFDDVASTEETNSEILRNIKIERMKLSEERVQNNAYLRQIAREQTLKDIAKSAVAEIKKGYSLKTIDEKDNSGENCAVLTISDWHYGIVCDNAWNTYNPEIAVERISKLRDAVIRKCSANGVSKLYIVNLGDMICGRIHLQLRLESRFDVITQTMQVSELLAQFINDLSQYFDIEYYDCDDNHSRVEPNKADSLNVESFVRIIRWYLDERFRDREDVRIHTENEYGSDIITFDCNGFRFAGVHGDKDKPSSVVDNLTLMTHESFDVVLTAHLHHFGGDEDGAILLQNGCLMGADSYAASIRKASFPSQNLLIVSETNPTEDICRIVV